MVKPNPKNERVKHRYRIYLQDAKGLSVATIDQALASIHAFEMSTRHKSFRQFQIEQARAFVRLLQNEINPQTGKPYAKATLDGTLRALRAFVQWLASQPEFRNRISYSDADYFRLSEKDQRIARATRPKRVPSVEEVQAVIRATPFETDIQKRDRAALAFTFMTGARVEAVVSARLKHIDIHEGLFHQDAKDVRTKRSKTFTTWFVPVGDDIREILDEWVRHLQVVRRFGPDDPLFPKTRLGHDQNRHFVAAGLTREHWASGAAIRQIFATAFAAIDLPPAHPHLMRDTLTQLGERICKTPEHLKAWSQNIGHDRVMTTLTSYSTVSPTRQGQLIRELGRQKPDRIDDVTPEMIAAVLDHLNEKLKPETPDRLG